MSTRGKQRLESLIKQMREIGEEGRTSIESAGDSEALEQLRVGYLGKKSKLNQMMRNMGSLGEQERPQLGKVANEVKQMLNETIRSRRAEFARADRHRRLTEEAIDVSLPGRPAPRGRLHPLTQANREITGIFRELGFEVASGPDMEDEFHNFEALNIPADHPARDMQDTFYMKGGGVLRTHTSPVQVRAMRGRTPPMAFIAPGRVYRCDTSDPTHSPMFNQIEGFMVDRDVRMSDLKGVLAHMTTRYFGPDHPIRFRPSFFPFTEPSAEVDILWRRADGREEWLEVLGAGMIHPNVLTKVGVDPEEYSGFAFGLGLERFVMLRYGVNDIRLFFENDLRFLRQF